MKPQELLRDIEKGKLLPLYYFYGPEKWLMDEALNKIKEKVLNPATRDFNLAVLDAEEGDPETILSSLQVFPVLSSRRLVVIRRADVLWKKGSSFLLDYILNPNPSTCAVFLGEKADLRTKFFQGLEKKGAVISFYPLFEKEIIRWVRLQAGQLGYSISAPAVDLLLDRVGPSLRELSLELQKLTLLPENRKSIEEGDVRALTGDMRDESPFELSRAAGRFNLREALRVLRKNLQQGEPLPLLLSLIVRQFRLIRKAQELHGEGVDKKTIEAKLRIPPRGAEDFWRQVEGFPSAAFEQLWLTSWKMDQELKSSRSDKRLLLEKYLWDLIFMKTVKSV